VFFTRQLVCGWTFLSIKTQDDKLTSTKSPWDIPFGHGVRRTFSDAIKPLDEFGVRPHWESVNNLAGLHELLDVLGLHFSMARETVCKAGSETAWIDCIVPSPLSLPTLKLQLLSKVFELGWKFTVITRIHFVFSTGQPGELMPASHENPGSNLRAACLSSIATCVPYPVQLATLIYCHAHQQSQWHASSSEHDAKFVWKINKDVSLLHIHTVYQV